MQVMVERAAGDVAELAADFRNRPFPIPHEALGRSGASPAS